MNRKALSYLLLVLIALQSLAAVVDVHPVYYSDAAPNFSDYAEDASTRMLESSTVTDLTDRSAPTDGPFHCHNHGCHHLVFLSGNLTQSVFLRKHQLHNYNHAISPLAPSSSLYRPPIA
jgi:hypothetical protein